MKSAALAAASLALLGLAASAPAQELRVGFGAVALPAPIGGGLAGYGGLSDRRAAGQLDPVEARALVFEREKLRVGLIALDVLIVVPEVRAPLENARERLDLDGLIVAATHTHSGPGGWAHHTLAERVTGASHVAGSAGAIGRAGLLALEHAIDDLAPAQVASGTRQLELAQNRHSPEGPHETALRLLRIDRAHAGPLALLLYGAHPTVVPPEVDAYSADWPGAARAHLAEHGWQALVLTGGLGDQRPGQGLQALTPRAEAPLMHARIEVPQPEPDNRFPCALWWLGPLAHGGARALWPERISFQSLRIGEARLLAIPAEPTSAAAAQLRGLEESSTNPWVIAFADAWLGYLVDHTTYRRGGYEACLSLLGRDGIDWVTDHASRSLRLLGSAP
jgi:hypothetical protein